MKISLRVGAFSRTCSFFYYISSVYLLLAFIIQIYTTQVASTLGAVFLRQDTLLQLFLYSLWCTNLLSLGQTVHDSS